MKNFRYVGVVLVITLAFSMLFTACSGPADEDIAAAQMALDDASNMGADVHSPNKYEKAKDLLAEAKILNDKGEYKKAKNQAELAQLNAEKAYEDAERLEDAQAQHD